MNLPDSLKTLRSRLGGKGSVLRSGIGSSADRQRRRSRNATEKLYRAESLEPRLVLSASPALAPINRAVPANPLTKLPQSASGASGSSTLPGVGSRATVRFTTAAAASQLAFTVPPSSAMAAAAINPAVTVAVEDAYGNPVTTDFSSVTLTLNTGTFSTGSNTATVMAVNGVATFSNLIVNVAGSYSLTATDGTFTTAVSNPFSVYLFNSIALHVPFFPHGGYPQSTLAIDSSGNLFGTTNEGGVGGHGTVFEIAHGTTSTITLASFNGNNGQYPYGTVTLDASGNLFGTTYQGGAKGYGTVYEIVHGTTSIITLASFNGNNGQNPEAGVTLDASGNLFGTTVYGGASFDGTVYEIVHGTTSITTLASFSHGNGVFPYGGVTFDASGNLFGTTLDGGASGYGMVYEIVHGTTSITTLASFNNINGANPWDGVTLDSSGNLFGTTQAGGSNSVGTVYEIPHGTTSITTIASFNSAIGQYPYAGLTLDSSGNLFGTTESSGPGGYGTVYEIVHGTTAITTLASFNRVNGSYPQAGVTLDASGNLFGATTNDGGAGDYGTVYEIVHGTTFITTLAVFNNINGANPYAGVTLDASGNLFGTTKADGPSGYGTVYEIVHGTTAINMIASFNGPNGQYPLAGVTLDAGGNLFGTTNAGGSSGYGTVYEIVHGTTAITTIASFNGANGANPQAGVTLDASGNLFGTTGGGGASGHGTVYEILHGTTAITTLASFNGTNGDYPSVGVTLDASGNLFGTTVNGGASGYGTVYEIAHGTTSITTLASFNGANGKSPYAGVTLDASGNLFGTTYQGGTGNHGTVYEIAHGTTSVISRASFNYTNGASPEAGVALDASGNLFGTTYIGGTGTYGTVFELVQGSSSIATLFSFNQTNGANPQAGITLDASGNLFGTTYNGGVGGSNGTVFELVATPPRLSFTTPPLSTTVGASLNGATGVQVAVQYSWGNPVASDSSTITLTLTGGVFSTGSSTATAAAVNGVATFSGLTINTPGNYTLTASDGTLATDRRLVRYHRGGPNPVGHPGWRRLGPAFINRVGGCHV